ncbi:LysR family transcriptional regulator [Emcibacter nanhaiensis]|uniref:LysR family transcriptional regulator n=1 Tax=Emcibacter nanhaiensis TaxID=1505037 RepID=A0A501PFH6_9PROT|nr:LysR family transcriptional regulator [Emcibacter nanhaiensis]TPD58898.1 LysR family transcriptional regulator [Emcibacter nanhaiensis]
MYNWNDLKFFLELSRRGKLVEAARRLHVDHTTVSRRITALEEALNARLFDKSPRGYQLTDAGLRLLPLAEQMEAQSTSLYQSISGKDASFSGTVRLAAPEAVGINVIAPNMDQFRQKYPDIELELVAETRQTSLSKREADIAITLARPSSGRLVAWKLGDYRLRLYGAPSYLANHPPIETADDLAGHDFIGYIDDLIQMPELRFMEELFRSPHIIFRSTNVMAQYRAALSGVGLAMVHCFMVGDKAGLTPVLPEQIFVERQYWLMVHEDLRKVARIDAVCGFLTDLFRDKQSLMLGRES